MRKTLLIAGIWMILFTFGCHSSQSIDPSEINQYEVKQATDRKIQDDFSFRLVSEKEEYEVGEEVNLYGELSYIGEKDEITITYGDSGISFQMEEKVRGYHISDIIKDIGVMKDIKRYEVYRVTYAKNKFYMEDEDESYRAFMEQFINDEGFPPGYYVVRGKADIAYNDATEREAMKTVEMELEIDFKVNH